MDLYECYRYVIYTEFRKELLLVSIWLFPVGFFSHRGMSGLLHGSIWILHICNIYGILTELPIRIYIDGTDM